MMDLKKFHEITEGIDFHLKKLESFTKSLQDIKLELIKANETNEKNIFYEMSKIKKDVTEIGNSLKKHGLPLSSEYEKTLEDVRDLIKNKNWPQAIDPELICDNDEKTKYRANGILDVLVCEPIINKKILDFGCGEGHIIPASKSRDAALILGYDIDESKYKFDSDNFTSNFKNVIERGPYDIIILHDVLDHATDISPGQILNQCKNVVSNDGRIYIRNHPWCARHGGHLYLNKNLSFLHLILDEFELMRVEGLQVEHNQKVTMPLETYRKWIAEAGLIIKHEMTLKTEVEDFFLNPSAIRERLNKHWVDSDSIKNFMEIDFVEYVLEKPKDISHQSIY